MGDISNKEHWGISLKMSTGDISKRTLGDIFKKRIQVDISKKEHWGYP